ncbi:MAG: hypothetical protein LBD11_08385 [Candidatus Peribacteria bacterium]|nr:hypothetical protein [Candidatus Peribacteria bacterium]
MTPSNDQVNWSLSALKGNDGTGSGDMNKATYDTNNNGIVDNSEQLAGYTPSTLPISTTAQSALDLKVNTSDIINDTTTGGTTVPLSAEMGKYLQEQITTAQQSNHDRGVVWKAINNS